MPIIKLSLEKYQDAVSSSEKGKTREQIEGKEKKMMMSIKVYPLADCDLIVCEILSRLPANSLMRFNCLCLLLAELLIPSDSESGDGGVAGAAVQRKVPLNIGDNTISRVRMLNIVNGLICLMDPDSHRARVYNPSTRESTPWIKSVVMRKLEEKGRPLKHDETLDAFGYDLATKDYKVVSLWSRRGGNNKADVLCEKLSLRNKSWKIIDAVSPVSPNLIYHLTHPVYANGSVYWLRVDGKPMVVELNMSTEKFRVLSVPNSVVFGFCGHYKTAAMEALLTKEDVRPNKRKREHEGDVIPTSTEICTLYDDQDKTKNSTAWTPASSAVSPDFDSSQLQRYTIVPIPGTDLFIVRSYDNFSCLQIKENGRLVLLYLSGVMLVGIKP
ncbi:F-box protein At1g11270-like [Papaver somniferum]|uniref:F-box protein At1g11270-like n=1 Tax=Papaver somniferum TaxID=3469 RepID=UPI000E6F63C7|nr:F-box protein At1g11270-like [Papaver somniferum]